MRKTVLLILFSCILKILSAQQWVKIDQLSEDFILNNYYFMTSDHNGFKIRDAYYSPSSGYGGFLYKTNNDWISENLMQTVGGGYGCCTIDQIFFLNDAIGFYAENYQGIESFHKTNDYGNNWSSISFSSGSFSGLFISMFFFIV